MPRGIVRECYGGNFKVSLDDPCYGRRRLIKLEDEKEKQWICKSCYNDLCNTRYCEGGFKLCPECKGDCKRIYE